MALWKARQSKSARQLPGDADAWFGIGVAAVEAGRLDEALYALPHAADLAPEDAARALAAAQLLGAAGCAAEADNVAKRALVHVGERSDLRAGLVRIVLKAGDDQGAREELE